MGRYLTAAQAAEAAATGAVPQFLADLAQSVPGLVRAYRWAMQSNGDTGYTPTGGSLYSCHLASIPALRRVVGGFGIGALDGGELRIANPDPDGDLFSDLFDNGPLEGASLAFRIGFITGSEVLADYLLWAQGIVDAHPYGEAEISIRWLDAAIKRYRAWPAKTFTIHPTTGYPYAEEGLLGRAIPFLLGDMTGKAFDWTTPASASWRHVPCPLIDSATPAVLASDIGTSDGQEEYIEIDGVICTIPSGSRSLAGEKMTLTKNVVTAQMRPHRINTGTSAGVLNPQRARSDDLDAYATVLSEDGLILEFPGLPSNMGAVGAADTLVDADVAVKIVRSAASGTGTMEVSIGLRDESDASLDYFTGHVAQSVGSISTTRATTSISVGLHITAATAFDELRRLVVKIAGATGTPNLYVHRVGIEVVIRSNEVLAGWRSQRVFRSQRGFIEASGLYADGGYIDAPGTTPRATPPRNPADQIEIFHRHKDRGMGLRAPSWTDPSAALTGAVGEGPYFEVTAGKAASFAPGDVAVCDREAVRIMEVMATESGDGSAQCSAWSFLGVSTANTNAGTVYATIVAAGEDVTISIYKDVAKTQLVARGTVLGAQAGGSNAYTLAAQSSSGLTATVTASYTADDDSITLVFSTLYVERGISGSRPTMHWLGSSLYICGTTGEIDLASFRGAAGVLQHPTGSELLANGELEMEQLDSLAPGWTLYDPDNKGGTSNVAGYARWSSQHVGRAFAGGTTPAIKQTVSGLVAGTWYRLGGWVRLPDGAEGTLSAFFSIDLAYWIISATASWTYQEFEFKATATSHDIYLSGPTTVGDVYWDEVSLRAVADWKWDHLVEGGSDGKPIDGRSWLNEACRDAFVRIIADQRGRASARARWIHRPAAETWSGDDLASEILRGGSKQALPIIRASRSSMDEAYTGVIVRYGYDHRLGDFRGLTYIDVREETTGQTVGGYSSGILTVADTAALLPTGRWTSQSPVAITTAGTAMTLGAVGGGPTPTLVSDGVLAGDWVWWYGGSAEDGVTGMIVLIAAVGSQTALTGAEVLPSRDYTVGDTFWFSCFPWLYRAGGYLFIPVVDGGPGSEDPNDLRVVSAGLDPLNLPTSGSPVVGDTIMRLVSDSTDGAGNRDQTLVVRDNRERVAMRRAAILGQTRTLTVDAPRVQDRETAVALRNALFDEAWPRWQFEIRTHLGKIARELADVVTLSHTLVPGSTMRTELVEQSISPQDGFITWRARELSETGL